MISTTPQKSSGVLTRISTRKRFLFFALLVTMSLLPFHRRISSFILEHSILKNESPTVGLVEDMINASSDPRATILAAWDSGKIAQREAAMLAAKKMALRSKKEVPVELKSLIEEGAFDPDMDVRENAFVVLREHRNAHLAEWAAAQASDCDPEVRLLGAENLRWVDAITGVPIAVRLLDDSDPRVVARGLNLLEKWTHQSFGVKLSEIAPTVTDEKSGLIEFHPGSEERCKAGATLAKAWWSQHQMEYGSAVPAQSYKYKAHSLPKREEFTASTIDGRQVKLSDARGNTALLYFWATPEGGCLNELEDLLALKAKFGNALTIYAVCLDNIEDDGGIAGEDDDTIHRRNIDPHEPPPPSIGVLRERLVQLVKEKNLSCPVILDEDFS
ncbi:MAG TPA: redoxin domain-containing protein, partial [Pseudomonadales bacterium]|nr:redoxin domain-containing protein [Pseudomonadales bacterium]